MLILDREKAQSAQHILVNIVYRQRVYLKEFDGDIPIENVRWREYAKYLCLRYKKNDWNHIQWKSYGARWIY